MYRFLCPKCSKSVAKVLRFKVEKRRVCKIAKTGEQISDLLPGRGRAWALSGKPEVHSQGFSFNYVLIWGGLRCSFFSEDLKRV